MEWRKCILWTLWSKASFIGCFFVFINFLYKSNKIEPSHSAGRFYAYHAKWRKREKKRVNVRKDIERWKNMRYNISWGEILKHTYYWHKCPNCGNPKMFLVRDDTRLVNFPGYCKKCKTESIITREPKSQIVNSWEIKDLLSGSFLLPHWQTSNRPADAGQHRAEEQSGRSLGS